MTLPTLSKLEWPWFTLLLTTVATTVLAPPLQINVTDAESGEPVACRIHLKDSQGKTVKATNLPSSNDHFVCGGSVRLDLAKGVYQFEIDRGPEYALATGHVEVTEGRGAMVLSKSIRRIANMAVERWWSGEMHLHRSPEHMQLLMQAEDLHIACANTWWNDGNPWANNPVPTNPLVHFDGDRFYDWLCGEDERGGGALLFIGLKQPLPIAGSQREYPSSMKFLALARQHAGVWVDVEKPFWWDMPMWLAAGKVDSVGIAHNHMHRDGVLDNEAWGKPRDRAKYPGPHGNGYWTQDLYYHLLNAGIRIPPSAGSASGVLPNPVGYNRIYAHVDGQLTWTKWWESVRRGRVFVSNGPLLRVRAGGKLPGEVFQIPARGEFKLELDGRLDSRDPIKAVEIIRNGRVERIISAETLRRGGSLGTLTFQEGGWFLVRAIADVPQTFRFASTGPFYVEATGKPRRVSRQSVQFFLDWVRERMAAIKLADPRQLEEVLSPQRDAEQFWQGKVSEATCD